MTGLLVALALAAWLVPEEPRAREDGLLAVLLPVADPRRHDAIVDLADYLGSQARLDLRVAVAADPRTLASMLDEALVIFCTDAVALGLPAEDWQALAVGRRRVPWNLRPVSVLVSRLGAEGGDEPWLRHPGRTVFGDSLTLASLAPLCREGQASRLPAGVGWGRDPYDHRAVLAAAAHGAYDHAVVRQWDAEAALAAGDLPAGQWGLQRLSEPLPDVVVLAARRLPGTVRLELQEALTLLGRDEADVAPAGRLARVQLGAFGLDGFNLMLGPDFERVRRQHRRCWPRAVP